MKLSYDSTGNVKNNNNPTNLTKLGLKGTRGQIKASYSKHATCKILDIARHGAQNMKEIPQKLVAAFEGYSELPECVRKPPKVVRGLGSRPSILLQ